MKKFLPLLILSIVFTSSFSFAQTTIEEYNYLTKGYRIQMESGLDMKKGYTLKDFGTFRSTTRTCEFKGLYNEATHKLAATLAIFHAANGDIYYFCIPVANSQQNIFDAYYSSLIAIDNVLAMKEYSYFLSMLYVQQSKN